MEQKQDSRATVYIVTEGSYSDYHIIAVFDSAKKAQDFIDAYVPGGEIEKFELNPCELELREGWKYYCVEMERDGSAHVRTDGALDYIKEAMQNESNLVLRHSGNNVFRTALETYCLAKDEQHAIKIANERRAQLIASGEWDSPD